jgi:hypothetical protein
MTNILHQWFITENIYCCKYHNYIGDKSDIDNLYSCCTNGYIVGVNATLTKSLFDFKAGTTFQKVVLSVKSSTLKVYNDYECVGVFTAQLSTKDTAKLNDRLSHNMDFHIVWGVEQGDCCLDVMFIKYKIGVYLQQDVDTFKTGTRFWEYTQDYRHSVLKLFGYYDENQMIKLEVFSFPIYLHLYKK